MSLFQQPAKNIPTNPYSTIPYINTEMFLHFYYFQFKKTKQQQQKTRFHLWEALSQWHLVRL